MTTAVVRTYNLNHHPMHIILTRMIIICNNKNNNNNMANLTALSRVGQFTASFLTER